MAALFTTLLGLSAILLWYFLYSFGKQNFIRETEAAIDIEIEHILAIAGIDNTSNVASYINKRGEESLHPIYFYQDKKGTVLAGNIDSIPEDVAPIKEGVISFIISIGQEEKTVAAKIHTFADSSRLLVARDITTTIESYEQLKLFSILIMVFMLLVVIISFFISTFVVTRINQIANTAKDIIHTGDLSRRIHIDSKWDDLSYLSTTLNELLTKIESLMQGIRNVSDNIAHDLRTPITRLRSKLEGFKNKTLTGKDINRLVSEADHILDIFNSLLRISNIEKGKRHQAFEQINISKVMADFIELYEPLAEEKQIHIKRNIEPDITLLGDRDLLFQMCANVLDNALKFSSKEQEVAVICERKDDTVYITISDQGIGISKEELEKVFDRFYRSDESRNMQGNGLGLSMVKAVAELHNATVTLEHNHPGLKVVICLKV